MAFYLALFAESLPRQRSCAMRCRWRVGAAMRCQVAQWQTSLLRREVHGTGKARTATSTSRSAFVRADDWWLTLISTQGEEPADRCRCEGALAAATVVLWSVELGIPCPSRQT